MPIRITAVSQVHRKTVRFRTSKVYNTIPLESRLVIEKRVKTISITQYNEQKHLK